MFFTPFQLIADHLVTFENIRELQERNRTLVQVVRRMTVELRDHKREQRVPDRVNEHLVRDLKQQLEELKEARDRQGEMLDTVKGAR